MITLKAIFVGQSGAGARRSISEYVVGATTFVTAENAGDIGIAVKENPADIGYAYRTCEIEDMIVSHWIGNEKKAAVASAFKTFVRKSGRLTQGGDEALTESGTGDTIEFPLAYCCEYQIDIDRGNSF